MKEISKTNEIVFYQTENSDVVVNVVFKDETFWLTQKAMAELFDCSVDNISLHLRNIFNDLELDKDSVTEDFSITAADGKNYKTKCYNLDAIIAVGYRVNSKKATKFRQWATKTLREYITKGFVINEKMLKNGKPFGKDYFLMNFLKRLGKFAQATEVTNLFAYFRQSRFEVSQIFRKFGVFSFLFFDYFGLSF